MGKKLNTLVPYPSIPAFTSWYPSGGRLKMNEISLTVEIIMPVQSKMIAKQGRTLPKFLKKTVQ